MLKKVTVATVIIAVLATVAGLKIWMPESIGTWCQRPNFGTHWKVPSLPEHKWALERATFQALTDGCFDGRKWSHEEALKEVRREY